MVGLPRESKTSRPIISAMLVCILRGYDARCVRPVQQMLRRNARPEGRASARPGRAEARPSEFGKKSLGADEAAPSNYMERHASSCPKLQAQRTCAPTDKDHKRKSDS